MADPKDKGAKKQPKGDSAPDPAAAEATQEPVSDGAPATDPAPDSHDESVRYALSEILDEARALTGYSRHHMAGALHGEERKTLTAEQAKEAGVEFATREVAR